MFKKNVWKNVVLTILLTASSATRTATAANLTVFAASSLSDAFTELGRAFDAQTGNKTAFSFADTQNPA